MLVAFQYSLDFALNAIFFTSDSIDKQADTINKEGTDAVGFWFIITNQFWQVLWPVLISIVISSLVNLIKKVPEKYIKELNTYLITKDLENAKIG